MKQATQYDQIGKGYVANVNPSKKYTRLPTILEMTGSIAHKDVLDLACGDGYFTRQLAQLKPRRIVGVDISPSMINMAKKQEKLSPLGIQYKVGDARKFRLKDYFDVITAIYLLDYAKNEAELVQMCKAIHEHLKPDGIFATITLIPKAPRGYSLGWKIVHPNGKRSFSDGDEISVMSDPAEGAPVTIHCYYWSKKTYTRCLKQAGFHSIEWKHVLLISNEGRRKYSSEFWEEMQKHSASIGVKAV